MHLPFGSADAHAHLAQGPRRRTWYDELCAGLQLDATLEAGHALYLEVGHAVVPAEDAHGLGPPRARVDTQVPVVVLDGYVAVVASAS